MVIALAGGLLVVALGEGSEKVPRPASPTFAERANSHDGGDPSIAVAALEEKVSTLEVAVHSALAALETRVSAVEEEGRSRPERQEERTAVLTSEEFERQYGRSVRAILERMKSEEEKLADAKMIRKHLLHYTQSYHLDAAQAEELFLLLLEVKEDMLEVERRFAPHGVAPHREWPDYQLMRAAWQVLLDRWLPAIDRYTGSGNGGYVIRDLTPPSLASELHSMAYR